MFLIDSNIIIYASKPEYEWLRAYLDQYKRELAASAISMVECLSFQLPKSQKKYIEEFFHDIRIFPVSNRIIAKAQQIQESKKLKAADAVIAATALIHKAKLLTNNYTDFTKVKSLVIIDPFKMEKG